MALADGAKCCATMEVGEVMLIELVLDQQSHDQAAEKRKKPTWRNTRRYSTTSAYPLLGIPEKPVRPLISYPTSQSNAESNPLTKCKELDSLPARNGLYCIKGRTQALFCLFCRFGTTFTEAQARFAHVMSYKRSEEHT